MIEKYRPDNIIKDNALSFSLKYNVDEMAAAINITSVFTDLLLNIAISETSTTDGLYRQTNFALQYCFFSLEVVHRQNSK